MFYFGDWQNKKEFYKLSQVVLFGCIQGLPIFTRRTSNSLWRFESVYLNKSVQGYLYGWLKLLGSVECLHTELFKLRLYNLLLVSLCKCFYGSALYRYGEFLVLFYVHGSRSRWMHMYKQKRVRPRVQSIIVLCILFYYYYYWVNYVSCIKWTNLR